MGNTFDDLKTRRSIRKYKSSQIKDSDLDAVLEAGTWAASGMGAQGGKIVAVQNPGDLAEMEKLNAQVIGDTNAKPFYGALTVIVVFADAGIPTWLEDGNMIIGNLLNAAHAAGLGSCYVYRAKETFESEGGKALMKKWGLGDNYKGVGNVILGYADENPVPSPRKSDYILKIK
jgi:nitroreductase